MVSLLVEVGTGMHWIEAIFWGLKQSCLNPKAVAEQNNCTGTDRGGGSAIYIVITESFLELLTCEQEPTSNFCFRNGVWKSDARSGLLIHESRGDGLS